MTDFIVSTVLDTLGSLVNTSNFKLSDLPNLNELKTALKSYLKNVNSFNPRNYTIVVPDTNDLKNLLTSNSYTIAEKVNILGNHIVKTETGCSLGNKKTLAAVQQPTNPLCIGQSKTYNVLSVKVVDYYKLPQGCVVTDFTKVADC